MIDSILCYFWLVRHGCQVSEINLFSHFSVHWQLHYEFPFSFQITDIQWAYSEFIPDRMKTAWHRNDWETAKQYSSFDSATVVTEEMLDDIPF